MIVLAPGKQKYLKEVNLFECVGKTIFIWCSIAGFHVKTRKKKSTHILFSDDDTDDALLFTQAADLMTTSSILLSFAEDGEQLMRYPSKEMLPDMIFLDLNMPVKNGIECLKEIRADRKLDWLPVIIYTTSDNPRDIDACFNLKANLHVVKPTSFENIIKTLKKVINMDFKKQGFPSKESFLLQSA